MPVTVDFTSVTGISAAPNPLTLPASAEPADHGVGAVLRQHHRAVHRDRHFATANPNVAIVDGSGLVTSTGIGSTTVTVASGSLPPVSVLVVVDAVQPSDLVVSPTSAAFSSLGQTQSLTVQFRYTDGTLGSGPFAVTAQSLDTTVATVNNSGVITATGEGTTSILVRSLSFTVNVTVSVTLPTTLPAPEIVSLGRPIAGEGDTLAILGRNFAGTPAENYVTINGRHAEVVGASFERLIALVPVGSHVWSGAGAGRRPGQQRQRPGNLSAPGGRCSPACRSTRQPASAAVNLGAASFYLQPGDDVFVSGDPNTIAGASSTGAGGAGLYRPLIVTVNGVDQVIAPSTQPVTSHRCCRR